MSNVDTVQGIYEAFGRGNIPAILATLDGDVDWEYGPGSTDVPWLQHRSGRDAVAGFFESLGALEIRKFAPKEFLEQGNTVIALMDLDFVVKATGKPVAEEDETHIWRFNDAGKVVRFRHAVDTHMHQLAYKP